MATENSAAAAPMSRHSTMRMGQSAADSVLDSSGEARWVKRLFVADNSALANGLGGPNPTLTTQALATRTAENIFQRYFGGDRWVGKEAPVSSIEPAITKAMADYAGLHETTFISQGRSLL